MITVLESSCKQFDYQTFMKEEIYKNSNLTVDGKHILVYE